MFDLISDYLMTLLVSSGVQILGKCEFLNPGGSVKDRVAVKIIEEVYSFSSKFSVLSAATMISILKGFDFFEFGDLNHQLVTRQ